MVPWSIAIKTVGRRAPAHGQTGSKSGEDVNSTSSNSHSSGSNSSSGGGGPGGRNNCNRNHADSGESNFTIEVDPDDPLHILHEKIEGVTGLTAEQQRLIYRGRIISGGNNNGAANTGGGGGSGRRELTEAEILLGETDTSDDHADASSPSTAASVADSSSPDANNERDDNTPRVRDVKGLCDNQTIHLVPRPAGNANHNASDNRGNNTNNNSGTAVGLGGGLGDLSDGGPGGLFDLGDALGGLGGGLGGGGGNNVTQLSGEAGMSLLAALLGASAGVGGSGSNAAGAATTVGGGAMSGIAGSTEGLGGVVERAAQMGVLGETATGGGPTLLGGAAGGDASSLLSALTSTGLGGFSSGTAELNDANATPGTGRTRQARENDTFPRLAPLGNAARRTASRRHRNPNASAAARARASAARLTEADIRVPDPGSAEPVRQGLLTLHTLLGNAELDRPERPATTTADALSAQPRALPPIRAPLDSQRRWYRGQWLDALDTVHQWLEATVVDVVSPSDILPNYSLVRSHVRNNDHERRTRRAAPDAVVSANDLEGRRRLLLEPLPDGHDFFASHDESDILYGGMRPRPDNHNVQLVLIHYNGWPHRWDEWIRSDSERLRPFRTRSRHRSSGGAGAVASPTPNAVFPSAPSTVISTEEDDVAERGALLEEVHRVLGRAERLVGHAVARSEGNGAENDGGWPAMPVDGGVSPTAHLPWRPPSHPRPSPPTDTEEEGSARAALPTGSDWRHRLDAARLRQLAPVLDRLGRMLTDAAPQVAALADSLPPPPAPMATLGSPTADGLPADGMTVATSDAAVEELAAQASHLYFGLGEEDREPHVNHPVAESAAATLSSPPLPP
ncbi:hypothetical protein ACHAXT_010826 [Thalassiosira profunda]